MSESLGQEEFDRPWTQICEAALLLNDGLVSRKFFAAGDHASDADHRVHQHHLGDDEDSSEELNMEDVEANNDESTVAADGDGAEALSSNATRYSLLHLATLLESDETEAMGKAIGTWTREIGAACALPAASSSSFISTLRKRASVLQAFHSARYRDWKRHVGSSTDEKRDGNDDADAASVMTRLSVLTMFPLIETLATVEGANYQQLCDSTLNVVLQVLDKIPAASLATDPIDCVDAFQLFIRKQVASSRSQLALRASVLFSVCSGNVFDMLSTISTILMDQRDFDSSLDLGPYLNNLAKYDQATLRPILTQSVHLGDWLLEGALPETRGTTINSRRQPSTALAADAHYLYVHLPKQGLIKIGHGLAAEPLTDSPSVVRGYVYGRNPEFSVSTTRCSVAVIGSTLFFYGETKDEKQTVIHLVDCDTLQQTEAVTVGELDETVSDVSICSDGKQLYVAYQSEGKHGSKPHVDVSVFTHSSASRIKFERTFTLKDFAVPQFDQCVFYCTGVHLAALIPQSGYNTCRIFSVESGEPLGDHSIHSEPSGMGAAFDPHNNVIWTIYPSWQKCAAWANLGPISVVPTPKVEREKSLKETVFCLFDHLDRLASRHPTYHSLHSAVPRRHVELNPKPTYNFTVAPSPPLFFSCSVNLMEQLLTQEEELLQRGVLTVLSLLKINFDLQEDIGSIDSVVAQKLVQILIKFSSGSHGKHIQKLACEALALGVHVLYPSDEWRSRVTALLHDNKGTPLFHCIMNVFAVKQDPFISRLLEDHENAQAFLGLLLSECVAEVTQNTKVNPSLSTTHQILLAAQRVLLTSEDHQPLISTYLRQILAAGVTIANQANASNCRSSILGIAIPGLAASLCDRGTVQLPLIRESLGDWKQLLKATEKLACSLPDTKLSDIRYIQRPPSREKQNSVVQTLHPYPHGRKQVKQTVTIKGSKYLSITFDPRSATADPSSDVLQLFRSPNMNDPVVIDPLDETPAMFGGSSFPKQRLIIDGESVTFLFSARSRPDSGSDAVKRWGFRCVVQQYDPDESEPKPSFDHWLLDTTNTIAVLCAQWTADLISGDPLTPQEQRCREWLSSGHFSGGLSASSTELHPFLQDLIQDGNHPLYAWIKTRKPRMASRSAALHAEKAERYVLAALLHQLGLVDDAQIFVKSTNMSQSPIAGKFLVLADESGKVFHWLLERGQLENMWRIAVEEKRADRSDFVDYSPEKIMILCEMKDVAFSLMNLEETYKDLVERMQLDIDASSDGKQKGEEVPSAHESVSLPLIERMKLLLQVVPTDKVVEFPSAVARDKFPRSRTLESLLEGSQDSQIVMDMEIEDVSDDDDVFEVSLHRSASYFPRTPTTEDRELARERNDAKTKEFGQRVTALRKWIGSYSAWQGWKKGGVLDAVRHRHSGPPSSPIQAVIAFAKYDMNVPELRTSISMHFQRAQTRVSGLDHLCSLLDVTSQFSSVMHHILGSLRGAFAVGSHYLAQVEACGKDSKARIAASFSKLLSKLTTIAGDSRWDPVTRLLCLEVCGMQFRSQDVEMLQPLFSALVQVSTHVPSPMNVDDGEENEPADAVRVRNTALVRTGWTAFRLLATQVVAWTRDDEQALINASATEKVISQVFTMCGEELGRIVHLFGQADTEKLDQVHIFELLSLLYLLGGSGPGLEVLSQEKNVAKLLGLLESRATPPKAKRVALKLLHRVLPRQPADAVPPLVSFCFHQIGRWMRTGLNATSAVPMDVEGDFNADEGGSSETQREAAKAAAKQSSGGDSGVDSQPHSLYLYTWPSSPQRLFDECVRTIGSDWIQLLAESIGAPSTNGPSLIRQLLSEIETKSKARLFTGSKQECEKIAQILTLHGATVNVMVSEDATESVNTSRVATQSPESAIWTTGFAGYSLAAQYVELIRSLSDTTTVPRHWYEGVRNAVTSGLVNTPAVFGRLVGDGVSAADTQYYSTLAALAVCGAFTEIVRIGARVIVSDDVSNGDVFATVVAYEYGEDIVQVVLESDDSESVIDLHIGSVVATSRSDYQALLLQSGPEVLSALINLFMDDAPAVELELESLPAAHWLGLDLKARAIKALSIFFESPDAANMILRSAILKKGIPRLIAMAHECGSDSDIATSESSQLASTFQLWDISSKPQVLSEEDKPKPMSQILPFFAHADLCGVLPTTMDISRATSMIFLGTSLRLFTFNVSLSSLRERGFSRARSMIGEQVVFANRAVPAQCKLYYFEVTVEKGENRNVISIGLSPPGARKWSNGSFRYQANGKKTSFQSGSERRSGYGQYFRENSIVGCLWNRTENTIIFTRNGASLGVAFRGVPSSDLVPAVGLGPGVRLCVNFGQHPFAYRDVIPKDLVIGDNQVEEDEVTRLAREEEEARLQAELAAEEERRRKEEEDLKVARREMANPILEMGFPLHHAMRALAATDYQSVDAAVNWALEHEVQDPPPEPPQPIAPPPNQESSQDAAPPGEKEEEEDAGDQGLEAEPSYNVNTAKTYRGTDCFSYPDVSGLDKKEKSLVSMWDESVLPMVRSFMESEDYRKLEIDDHVQQIRMALVQGNEPQAREIVNTIFGGAVRIRYPGAKSSESERIPSLTMANAQPGMFVSLRELPASSYADGLTDMLDRTGRILVLDIETSELLVEFYNSEFGELVCWWCPVNVLVPAQNRSRVFAEDRTKVQLLAAAAEEDLELAKLYARKSILSLTRFVSIGEKERLSVSDVIALVGKHLLSCDSFLPEDPVVGQKLLGLGTKLRQLIMGHPQLASDILDQCVNLMETESLFCGQNSLSFSQAQNSVGDVVKIKLANARALMIDFMGPNHTSFHPDAGAVLGFFEDEQCEVPLCSFTHSSTFSPFTIQGSQCFFRFSVPKMDDASSCSYFFTVSPAPPNLALSIWLGKFLLATYNIAQEFVSLRVLYSKTVAAILQMPTPNAAKEALLDLLAHILRYDSEGLIDRQGLQPLMHEMLALHEQGRTAPLLSTYLQALIEVFVWDRTFPGDEKEINFAKQVNEPDAAVDDLIEAARGDKNLAVAIQLAKAMNEGKDKVVPIGASLADNGEGGDSNEDDQLRLAMQMSMAAQALSSQALVPSSDDARSGEGSLSTSANPWPIFKLSSDPVSKFGVPVPPPPQSSTDPKWLTDMVWVGRFLSCVTGAPHKARFLRLHTKEVWPGTCTDSGLLRLVKVLGIPHGFDISAVVSVSVQLVGDGFGFFMTKSPTAASEIVESINRLKLPEEFEESDISAVVVTPDQLDVVDGIKDPSVEQWLKAQLVTDGVMTPRFQKVLHQVFSRFGRGATCLLRHHLDRLQQVTEGKPLSDEDASNLLFNYDTQLTPAGETGLTQKGLCDLYFQTATEAPVDCWRELVQLGYDFELNWNHYSTLEEALNAFSAWTLSHDVALVSHLESLTSTKARESPAELQRFEIFPPRDGLLRDSPVALLRLRFSMICALNAKIGGVLPLVNFSGLASGSMCQLLSVTRGLVFRFIKTSFSLRILDATGTLGNQPALVIERLRLAVVREQEEEHQKKVHDDLISARSDQELLKVLAPNTCFGLSMTQLRDVDVSRLRQKKPPGTEPHYSLKIVFKGENVEGEGGPYRQFFTDASAELKDRLPLLIPCPNAQSKIGDNRDKYVLTPAIKSALGLEMYEFLGALMGIAIRTGVYLNVDLAPSIWKALVGITLQPKDLRAIDESFYGTLEFFKMCSESEWEEIYDWTCTLSDQSVVALTPKNPTKIVRYSQRVEWVQLALKARLEESDLQLRYISKGLQKVVPKSLFHLWTEEDLELRVCGSSFIDVSMLKRHTVYSAISSESNVVKWFWEALESMTQDDLKRFMRFAWGQERLPVSDEEWNRTSTRMLVKPYTGGTRDHDSVFPHADTCFFNIMLPQYSSLKVLKEKLLTAIYTDADSMDADVNEEAQLMGSGGARGLGLSSPASSFLNSLGGSSSGGGFRSRARARRQQRDRIFENMGSFGGGGGGGDEFY